MEHAKNGSALSSSVDHPVQNHWNDFQDETGAGIGEPGFETAARYIRSEACQIQDYQCRPFLLDRFETVVDEMAGFSDHREAGNRDRLAEEAFQKALDESLHAKQTTGTKENKKGNQGSHLSNDGREQLGSTANLFRAVKGRLKNYLALCRQNVQSFWYFRVGYKVNSHSVCKISGFRDFYRQIM